ncbi:MAG: hypothetical protein ACK6EB_37260, partial [Planctomyces sp.]
MQSLSESELAEFLETLPTEDLDAVIAQLQPQLTAGDYASERSRKTAEAINARTAASQEIGPLPGIADRARRERCRTDLVAFCGEYFAPTFYLALAPYQVAMLERFQHVTLHSGR